MFKNVNRNVRCPQVNWQTVPRSWTVDRETTISIICPCPRNIHLVQVGWSKARTASTVRCCMTDICDVITGLPVSTKHASIASRSRISLCRGNGRPWCNSWGCRGWITKWTLSKHRTSGSSFIYCVLLLLCDFLCVYVLFCFNLNVFLKFIFFLHVLQVIGHISSLMLHV